LRRLTPLIALLFVLLACAPAQARTVSLQPAAGAAGSVVALRGEGLPARRSVVISFRGGPTRRVRTDAGGAFATTVRIPARARGALKIASRVGSVRLVNRFRVGGAPAGEVAGPRALRVRWTPLQATVGTPVHVSGTGVRGRKVTIARRARS